MKTIWKYDIKIEDSFTLSFPCTSEFLAVQEQRGEAVMWCEVDPDSPQVNRTMFVVGTGHKVPADAQNYLGTFQLRSGIFVFHLYSDSLEAKGLAV